MGKIVLSYRRDDAKTITNWLYEKLVDRYGAETVFRDIDSIAPTENFKKRIGRALKDCDFVVAVIGPAWHGPLPDGQSRINAANDWVRVEIETAMQLDIPLLPVLVEEAEMPDPEMLPPSLREVTEINALPISSGGARFYDDLNKLFTTIESVAGISSAGTAGARPAAPKPAPPPPQPAATVRTAPVEPRPEPPAPQPSPSPPPHEPQRYNPGDTTAAGYGPSAHVPPPYSEPPGRAWRLFEGRTLLLLFAMPAIVMTILWAWAFENVFSGGVSGAIAPLTVFAVAGLFMVGLGLFMKRKARVRFIVALLLGTLIGLIVFAVVATTYFRSENDMSMGFIVFVLGGAAATAAGFALGSIKWGGNLPPP